MMNKQLLWNYKTLTKTLNTPYNKILEKLNETIDKLSASGILLHLFEPNKENICTVVIEHGKYFFCKEPFDGGLNRLLNKCFQAEEVCYENNLDISNYLENSNDFKCNIKNMLSFPLQAPKTGVYGCIQFYNKKDSNFEEHDQVIVKNYLPYIAGEIYQQCRNTNYVTNREVILSARDLTKIYSKGKQKHTVLDGVNIDIYQGEILVVWGNSGSGKTTLLNILSGMDKTTSGEIFMENSPIHSMNDKSLTRYRRDKIGYIFQKYNLINDLNVCENIKLSQSLTNSTTTTEQVLEMVGMKGYERHYPSQLSGGQQQRVAIARALVKDSKILFCDEPTGALDENIGKQVLSILQKIVQETKGTIILVTHNPQMLNIADRSITLRDGKIVDRTFRPFPMSAEKVEW